MAMLQTLSVVTVFWFVLFVLDKLARHYRPTKASYSQQLEEWGISLSFAHVRCYTTKLNRMFQHFSNCSKSMCRAWFNLGVLIGVLLLVGSILVLSFTLCQSFITAGPSERVLTPVMPGVNLPWNDIAYYLLTLAVCGIFHEFGHALAASTEQVRVNGFGLFMLFLYPGAFVDLHSDHLSVISPKRQLRIYCAGVWHNVILVLLALLFLWCLPVLLATFYTSGVGLVVTSVPEDSVFAGKLSPNMVVTAVNSCPVYSTSEWYSCIETITLESQPGYCMYTDVLEREPSFNINQTKILSDGSRECCAESQQDSSVCFQVFYGKGKPSAYQCLTARTVSARETCHSFRDCKGVVEYACVFPTVSSPTKLVRISHTDGPDALFLGDPRALYFAMSVSNYYPASTYSPLWLPELLQTLCMYIISLSSALALLNMVPAYFLDGQWALMSLVELWCERSLPDPSHRKRLCNVILTFGSILLLLNIGLALWTLFTW